MISLLLRLLLLLLILFPASGHTEESYTFDIGEIEKKPYHFGAYLEMRPMIYLLDRAHGIRPAGRP